MRTNTGARATINNEPMNPQNSQPPRKTYSQVVSNSTSVAEQSTSTDAMLAQIMQMLKDQDLRLKKIESNLKINNKH